MKRRFEEIKEEEDPASEEEETKFTTTERLDLEVPYEEKDLAKTAGARWDPKRSVWYVRSAEAARKCAKWKPTRTVDLRVPQAEERIALLQGATWNHRRKVYMACGDDAIAKCGKWIPEDTDRPSKRTRTEEEEEDESKILERRLSAMEAEKRELTRQLELVKKEKTKTPQERATEAGWTRLQHYTELAQTIQEMSDQELLDYLAKPSMLRLIRWSSASFASRVNSLTMASPPAEDKKPPVATKESLSRDFRTQFGGILWDHIMAPSKKQTSEAGRESAKHILLLLLHDLRCSAGFGERYRSMMENKLLQDRQWKALHDRHLAECKKARKTESDLQAGDLTTVAIEFDLGLTVACGQKMRPKHGLKFTVIAPCRAETGLQGTITPLLHNWIEGEIKMGQRHPNSIQKDGRRVSRAIRLVPWCAHANASAIFQPLLPVVRACLSKRGRQIRLKSKLDKLSRNLVAIGLPALDARFEFQEWVHMNEGVPKDVGQAPVCPFLMQWNGDIMEVKRPLANPYGEWLLTGVDGKGAFEAECITVLSRHRPLFARSVKSPIGGNTLLTGCSPRLHETAKWLLESKRIQIAEILTLCIEYALENEILPGMF